MIPAQSQGPKGWYYRRVVPWMLGRKHTCISISQFTQGILRSIGIQSEVVYTWLSPRLVKHIGERQKIHSGSPYLFIGTSAPHKNLECIFSAYLATELRRPLVCVVPAWDKPHLEERVASIELSAKVSFESDLDDEQMAALYKSAMALISPSLLEGFGMPLIEAMAFGCPVICSDIPIYREVAGDAALFFDVESADNLLAALVKIENMDIWCDYQQRGNVRVEIFSWESAVEGYRKRLQKILDSQPVEKTNV